MVKNNCKKVYLTDTYEDENLILESNKIESTLDENKCSDDEPTIEFIIEKNENDEKQIRLNFQFKLEESNEIIKLDLEISKNTYLELADELLK